MAIYHFSGRIIQRSKGQSAIASASYRSGEKLVDEITGEAKFYKREVQPETMILAPSHAPEWVHDRQRLWNEVEAIEKNWNSQLAREFNIALPRELSNEQQVELIRNFAQKEFVDEGMVADIAIHRDDKDNPHAHIMLTVRPFNEDGTWGSKKKRDYIFNENGEHILDEKGKKKFKTIHVTNWDDRATLGKWREEWANHTNLALEKAGFQDRISHLSHEARGLEQVPTVHLGHVAHAMEKEGKESERGNINREIKKVNDKLTEISKEIEELTKELVKLKRFSPEEIKILDKAKVSLKKENFTYKEVVNRLEQVQRFQNRILSQEKQIHDKGFANYTDKDRQDLAKYSNQRRAIQTEKDILSKTKSIMEKDFINRLASKYPDNPEIKYIKFDKAFELNNMNKRMGRIVPINEIKELYNDGKKSLNNPSTPQEKMASISQTTDMLGGLVDAIQQANLEMNRAEKKQEKPRYRGQNKKELTHEI